MKSAVKSKQVMVTFDYEGLWGMPHKGLPYDLPAVTEQLLEVLARHDAKAVFFTSSKLFYDYPDTIKKLHAAGHEIGVHGHAHEHLHNLDAQAQAQFGNDLQAACQELKKLTGRQPVGFRAPYLMGPLFYVPQMYQLLAGLGFTWISNREIRTPEELWRPGRLPFGAKLLRVVGLRQLLLGLLNLGLLRNDQPTGHQGFIRTISWLSQPVPFDRPEGLVEHPLVSPLDCDLVGFPRPTQPSGQALTNFARQTMISDFDRADAYFNLNVHDWIIGTSDRLQILDDVLAHIRQDASVQFILPGRF